MGILRESLKSYAMDNHFKKYGEFNAKELEKIADKFAVNFGLWLTKKGNYNINNWNKTMEEILKTYKEENGI